MNLTRGHSTIAGSNPDKVQIAVTNTIPTEGNKPQNYLMHLSKSLSLSELILELCAFWDLKGDCETLGLRFEKTAEYVTQDSVSDIKTGTILKLCPSSNIYARDIVDNLSSGDEKSIRVGCEELLSTCRDFTVIQEILNLGGIKVILDLLNDSKSVGGLRVPPECQNKLLGSLVEILKLDDISLSWDDECFDKRFIGRVARDIYNNDVSCLRHSFPILENLCQTSKLSLVQEAVPTRSLLAIVTIVSDLEIQKSVFSLYNILFASASQDRKEGMHATFEELGIRDVILNKILPKNTSAEMKKQLLIIQVNLFHRAAYVMKQQIDDQKVIEKIKELRRLTFSPDLPKGTSQKTYREDYKSLGFTSLTDPTNDFRSVPPGMLPLDLMLEFAQNQPEVVTKMTIENSYRMGDQNHACPFAASSIALTKLLSSAFNIGVTNIEDIETDLQPMVFHHEKPLDVLFGITIQHLFKTWREMRATAEDFEKVIDVTREQLSSGLKMVSLTCEEFQRSLKTYSQVSDGWKEATKAKNEHESKAVEELRHILRPEMVNLVQRQRLGFIVAGTRFTKLRKEGSGQHLYMKLNPNHKTLYYDDWNETDSVPSIDNLSNKVAVQDIKAFLIKQDCFSHLAGVKDLRRNRPGDNFANLAMSILTDSCSIDVTAPDAKSFDYWCDAINTLLRKEMVSSKAAEDIELFLNMEVKIKLLDVEGIELPKVAPPIPSPPPPIDACRHRQ